jgi:hypothetical protein
MVLRDRVQKAAAAVRAHARRFAAAMPPRLAGLGLSPPDTPFTNERTERRVASRDALEGRIAIGAGPMLDRHSTYPATRLDPLKIEATQSTTVGGARFLSPFQPLSPTVIHSRMTTRS